DSPNVEKVQRFDVTKDTDIRPWSYDGERLSMNRLEPQHEVICKLDHDELLVKGERQPEAVVPTYDMHELQTLCQRLREKACEIETQAQVLTKEGSIAVGDFQQLLQSLEQHDSDLEGTLHLIRK